MKKYALLISYNGTPYCGWQSQGKASGPKPSIQSTLENTLSEIVSEPVTLVGSGRTDAGVHAVGQVAHFKLERKDWETRILQKALNSLLPSSIAIRKVLEVPMDFHAQRSALKKQYSYYFQQGTCAPPSIRPGSYWIQRPLDIEAMQKAGSVLVGSHDFKPFQAAGAKSGPTVREIFEFEITKISIGFPLELPEKEFFFVRMRIIGSGFLKQMVRGIAGTLLQVGEGKRSPDCVNEILTTQNRSLLGPTAPARALWLERVWYPIEM